MIKIIYKSPQPPDSVASAYFRKQKYIGSKERRFLSECVFDSLRNLTLYIYAFANAAKDTRLGARPPEKRRMDDDSAWGICFASALLAHSRATGGDNFSPALLLNKILKIDENEILPLFETVLAGKSDSDSDSAKIIINNIIAAFDAVDLPPDAAAPEQISIRYSMPQWIVEELAGHPMLDFDLPRISGLTGSFLTGAPLGLRVNTLLATRDSVLAELKEMGIDAVAGALSPDAIIVNERVRLLDSTLYMRGKIEVQDEGSQVISWAAAPAPGDRILDACAGAGGKSLHLSAITDGDSDILANDTEPRRLKEVSKRAKRAGYNNISTIVMNMRNISDKIKPIFDSFDLVLVDAPCSGMGTLRRNPMKKYTITPRLLSRLAKKQYEILEFYSNFVRPGGALVYATCSIMPQENEEVVINFLKNHQEFRPTPIAPHLERFGIRADGLGEDDHMLRLSPDKHNTDGFFVARMVKDIDF
ncbi:MAG: RsmB/NOP family class I SAM-dependent RNA methyltransferase [Candidatus Kapaibacterium sp.]